MPTVVCHGISVAVLKHYFVTCVLYITPDRASSDDHLAVEESFSIPSTQLRHSAASSRHDRQHHHR